MEDEEEEGGLRMSVKAMIMISFAWGAIISLCIYCFYRIFSEKAK